MKRIAIAFLVFLLCVSVAGASSSETAIEAVSGSNGSIGILSVGNYIIEGQTNWHSKIINTYTESLNVNLNWGDTTDSLKLYVYNPSGSCVGVYYDYSDGSTNGRINVNFHDDDGLQQGTWRYAVYGYSVIDTEDYSI
jgi:hypothetical protein